MSYQIKPRQTYQPYRRFKQMLASPRSHEDFKAQWDSNFDNAINQAQSLKSKGFMVEECLEKGAMMESQAKRIAKNLQQAGWEVEFIPVARWQGENVVFMVYKPPKEGEAVPPTKVEKPQPKPRKLKEVTPEELTQNFIKAFTYKYASTVAAPDPSQLKTSGVMIDPKNVAALIDPTTTSTHDLINMYKKAISTPTPNPIAFMNSSKFRATLMNNSRKGLQNVKFDMIGKNAVSIDNFRKALKVLGDGPVHVYLVGEERPVYVARPDGWAIAIAPVIEPSNPVHIDDLIKEAQGKP